MATKGSKKAAGLNPTLKNLSISSTKPSKSTAPPDSWEEEATTSTTSPLSSPSTPVQDHTPGPPPPTPMSPSHRHGNSTDWSSFPRSSEAPRSNPREVAVAEKRPEKSSATAGRMIAGALGVKGPKMTEEQRQYERVVREKERKRIEGETEDAKRREREKEDARKAVWDD